VPVIAFWGTPAAAAGLCDSAPSKIKTCAALPVEVFRLPEAQALVSRPIKLDPKRLYWACCTSAAVWAGAVSLVVTRRDRDIAGETQNCRHTIAPDPSAIADERGVDAIWPETNPDPWAAMYGPIDLSGKEKFPYCTGSVPEIPAGSQLMGSILLISVEAKDVPDAK
jgi:hypothetical protein